MAACPRLGCTRGRSTRCTRRRRWPCQRPSSTQRRRGTRCCRDGPGAGGGGGGRAQAQGVGDAVAVARRQRAVMLRAMTLEPGEGPTSGRTHSRTRSRLGVVHTSAPCSAHTSPSPSSHCRCHRCLTQSRNWSLSLSLSPGCLHFPRTDTSLRPSLPSEIVGPSPIPQLGQLETGLERGNWAVG